LQLSKGFHYAVRCLVHLALQPGNSGADLKTLSRVQAVPPSYVAKIMSTLVRGGLVTSRLGRKGGYVLRKAPSEITLLQVYELMEGRINFIHCVSGDWSCSLSPQCAQRPVWGRLQSAVEAAFNTTRLSDLVPRPMCAFNTPIPQLMLERRSKCL
jgi:Rrf2 family protein